MQALDSLHLESLHLEGRRLTRHFCKYTMFSHWAKHGDNWEARLILGGHAGQYAMAINYSRDSMARPFSAFCYMRGSGFDPDETRSGLLLKPATIIVVKAERENEDAVRKILRRRNLELDHVTTSSGGCEAWIEEEGPGLVVRDLAPPEGVKSNAPSCRLCICSILQCGRRCDPFHMTEVEVRYDACRKGT